MKSVEFYFDFASPFAYLAAEQIEALARKHGRQVDWRPIMLGVAFKETGMGPLFHQPLRGSYAMTDFLRSARLAGIPAVIPERFPYVALAVSRAYYWLEAEEKGLATNFALSVFRRYFVDGVPPESDEDAAAIGQGVGCNAAAMKRALQDPAVKSRLKEETATAIRRGVFGAPFMFVDGEAFWGADRLSQIDAWLERGGW